MNELDWIGDPLVSIVLPVHNGSRYMEEAINSALVQTYSNCEILVINDGSNDNGRTEDIALSYGKRVRYFTKPNGGVSSALNFALTKVHGPLFSWLSHDDLYDPYKIEMQVGALRESFAKEAVIYSDYDIFDDDGRICRVRLLQTDQKGFRYRLARQSNINGCTLLIPVKFLHAIGGFKESLFCTQDYEVWFRLANVHPFLHVPQSLVLSRAHDHQGAFTRSRLVQREAQELHLMFVKELTIEEMPVTQKKSLSICFLELAKSFWARGFYDAALFSNKRAIEHGATNFLVAWFKWQGCAQYMVINCLKKHISPISRIYLRQRLEDLMRKIRIKN